MDRPLPYRNGVRVTAAATVAGGVASASELVAGISIFYLFFLAVAAGWSVSYLIEIVIVRFFSTWKPLRNLILGRDNIEGYWTDLVSVGGEERLGVLYIDYSEDGYQIEGWQYDLDGRQCVSWNSVITKFDGVRFEYLYKANYHDREASKYGYSEFKVCRSDPTDKPPSLIGDFLDLGKENSRITFQAWRQGPEFVSLYLSDAPKAVRKLSSQYAASGN